MTKVFLIRHGATALNRLDPPRIQGQRSDPPLDGVGLDQARRTADALAHRPLDAVYTSPLERARQTARVVGQPHDLAPIVVTALIEANVGRWEGRTWAEASDLDPGPCAEFLARPGVIPYPEGESFQNVQERAVPALAALAANHPGGRIAVVAHNVVNRACLAAYLGIPIDQARALRQANGGLNILDFDGPTVHVVTLNSTTHLGAI